MAGMSMDQEPGGTFSPLQHTRREEVLAAIVLLLGPDTDYYKRTRASQSLARSGAEVLPLLLHMLHTHPEIVIPAWPWWPPQYEQIGRLLIQLSQSARLSLTDLLHTSKFPQPPGPVLWTSIIEAMGHLPHREYEPLLREGLAAPWRTVRYAAAMAIAKRAVHVSLCPETRVALYQLQMADPEMPVRLVASCALLRCADASGLDGLCTALETATSTEERRAVLFILATELSLPLEIASRKRLAGLLLLSLSDPDLQSALYAARALSHIANASILPRLASLLDDPRTQTLLATLTALEELASRKTMRYAMQQQQVPGHIMALLRETDQEIRRQACYTLATIGGEHAIATLGMLLLDSLHPAHLEAIEALRLLPDLQQPTILSCALRWLEYALAQPLHQDQTRALDSLSVIIWKAHARHQYALLHTLFDRLQESGSFFQLLASADARIRQRTIELLSLLDPQLLSQRATLLEMLHHDIDSQVRIHLAHTFGQAVAHWAIPDLLLALLDPDERVAEAVLEALLSISSPDDPLVRHAFQEIAAYHVPLWKLRERRRLAHAARIRLRQPKHLPGERPLAT